MQGGRAGAGLLGCRQWIEGLALFGLSVRCYDVCWCVGLPVMSVRGTH